MASRTCDPANSAPIEACRTPPPQVSSIATRKDPPRKHPGAIGGEGKIRPLREWRRAPSQCTLGISVNSPSCARRTSACGRSNHRLTPSARAFRRPSKHATLGDSTQRKALTGKPLEGINPRQQMNRPTRPKSPPRRAMLPLHARPLNTTRTLPHDRRDSQGHRLHLRRQTYRMLSRGLSLGNT
jgi:hypothetical protein